MINESARKTGDVQFDEVEVRHELCVVHNDKESNVQLEILLGRTSLDFCVYVTCPFGLAEYIVDHGGSELARMLDEARDRAVLTSRADDCWLLCERFDTITEAFELLVALVNEITSACKTRWHEYYSRLVYL